MICRLCGALQDVRAARSLPSRNFTSAPRGSAGTPIAKRRGMDFNDFTQYPMGLIGGLVALFVFAVFIGTWWWYGMREMDRRAEAAAPRIMKPSTRLPSRDGHSVRA